MTPQTKRAKQDGNPYLALTTPIKTNQKGRLLHVTQF